LGALYDVLQPRRTVHRCSKSSLSRRRHNVKAATTLAKSATADRARPPAPITATSSASTRSIRNSISRPERLRTNSKRQCMDTFWRRANWWHAYGRVIFLDSGQSKVMSQGSVHGNVRDGRFHAGISENSLHSGSRGNTRQDSGVTPRSFGRGGIAIARIGPTITACSALACICNHRTASRKWKQATRSVDCYRHATTRTRRRAFTYGSVEPVSNESKLNSVENCGPRSRIVSSDWQLLDSTT